MRKLLSVLLLAVPACAWFAGIDGLKVGECKGGPCPEDESPVPPGESPDAFAPDPVLEPACTGKPMPQNIRVGPPGNRFCIDRGEVSRAEYQVFIDAKVSSTTQPPECVWNTSFAPDDTDAGSEQPVTGVDWCDALAYCTWAGKYLCGVAQGGAKTGPVTAADLGNYQTNQWLIACSAAGQQDYSYAGTYDPSKCNLPSFDAGTTLKPGTAWQCAGGYPGLFDMIGNVWEWYDGPYIPGGAEVDGGDGGPASDSCALKGGSYLNDGPGVNCRLDAQQIRRDLHAPWLGFRCCGD